ncbi:MAG: transaldolase [Solirubrobacterales bacterium]|nr:transaldolase [Solirubrobacterales bacterium]
MSRAPDNIRATLPEPIRSAVEARLIAAAEQDVLARIWAKDDTVFGEAGQPEVANRLGWLDIADRMAHEVDDLVAFADGVRADGITDVVLLGMGGSSLAPEVLRRSLGSATGFPALHVLDTTDAEAVLDVEAATDPGTTLYIVATKSGGTIETLSGFAHFHALQPDGSHFVAITDPRSGLADLAQEHGFRRTFLNDPDIGGRYSALSYFGLVPAALIGADVQALLQGAEVAAAASRPLDTKVATVGLWLGVAVGELAAHRMDKLTFFIDAPLDSFGLWVEQLVAESTGKRGKGILPVADEPLGTVEVYGHDRVFVHVRNGETPHDDHETRLAELAQAGHPTITMDYAEQAAAGELGSLFFTAEMVTAVAGWVLGINPFDQPNVQEAKDNTSKALAARAAAQVDATDHDLELLLRDAGPPDYVAILGYTAPSEAFDAAIAELRALIRDATQATTTFGYGPRYLHSTGQLHKGGPKNGRFLELVHPAPRDVPIPGEDYSFETLKAAQAIGDLTTLRLHGLPAHRVTLHGDAVAAVEHLIERVTLVLGAPRLSR